MRPDVATVPLSQLALILSEPGRFVRLLWTEGWTKGPAHLAELVGYFGWRQLPLPPALAVTTGLILLLSLLTFDVRPLRLRRRFAPSSWLSPFSRSLL